LNPWHSGDKQAPYPLHHEDILTWDASASCLGAKQGPDSYPRKIAMSLINRPPAECIIHHYTHGCITLEAKEMNTRAKRYPDIGRRFWSKRPPPFRVFSFSWGP
jgi:hypothetical protein